MTSEQVKLKMCEIEDADNLTLEEILKMNMLDYKKTLHKRAIAALRN